MNDDYPDVRAFIELLRDPDDEVGRLVLADLCAETPGYGRIERELREHPPQGESDGGGGDGGGDGGCGDGYGGYGGYGDGGDGDGGGDGGCGDGYGGYGYGGDGGYGCGVRFFKGRSNVMLSKGSKVLVLVPGSYRNFAFCGRVGECVGSHTYNLTSASMVINSGNGPDWPALARGENRPQAVFSKIKGECHVGPQFGGVFSWVGELPGEVES